MVLSRASPRRTHAEAWRRLSHDAVLGTPDSHGLDPAYGSAEVECHRLLLPGEAQGCEHLPQCGRPWLGWTSSSADTAAPDVRLARVPCDGLAQTKGTSQHALARHGPSPPAWVSA